jgi:hypothetical protein
MTRMPVTPGGPAHHRSFWRSAPSFAVLVALLLFAVWAPSARGSNARRTFTDVADAAVSPHASAQRFGRQDWLRVGPRRRWRTYLRFRVQGLSGPATRALLVLRVTGRGRVTVDADVALGHQWSERQLTARTAPRVGARVARARARVRCGRRGTCPLVLDVTRAVTGNGVHDFVLTTRSRGRLRILSREAGHGGPRLMVTFAPASAAAPPPSTSGPPAPVAGIWTSPAELASRPTSGSAWTALRQAADGSLGTADIANQDSDHDVNTLAVALVYARTGVAAYRTKAAAAIGAAIGTETGGRTLALGRNLASYVIAADLIGLGNYDSALDGRFRSWLSAVRTESLDGETLISTHETRPNNWGTMAGASRVAADVYLGDSADLARAAQVFQGWTGERSAYAGFSFGDLSWQADPSAPVAVDLPGAVVAGVPADGALTDDMRRGCAPKVPPCHTDYAWEGMQGAVVQAEILQRRGYDAFGWGSRAILRAASFLDRLDQQYGGWWASADDEWQPWVINAAYGTSLRAVSPASPGKVMGWTDWVFKR